MAVGRQPRSRVHHLYFRNDGKAQGCRNHPSLIGAFAGSTVVVLSGTGRSLFAHLSTGVRWFRHRHILDVVERRHAGHSHRKPSSRRATADLVDLQPLRNARCPRAVTVRRDAPRRIAGLDVVVASRHHCGRTSSFENGPSSPRASPPCRALQRIRPDGRDGLGVGIPDDRDRAGDARADRPADPQQPDVSVGRQPKPSSRGHDRRNLYRRLRRRQRLCESTDGNGSEVLAESIPVWRQNLPDRRSGAPA